MTDDARAAALMQKMLRKKLYVVLSKPRVAPDQLRPVLAAHLDYMIDLEKRGAIFASGPLADAEQPPQGAPSPKAIRSSKTACAASN
jgi:uncharacterized protein YciI